MGQRHIADSQYRKFEPLDLSGWAAGRSAVTVHAARIDRPPAVLSTLNGKVELHVIGILMVVNTVVCDDISYRAANNRGPSTDQKEINTRLDYVHFI